MVDVEHLVRVHALGEAVVSDLHVHQDCPAWPGGLPPRVRGRRPLGASARTVQASLKVSALEAERLVLLEGSLSRGLRAALDRWLDA